MKLIIQVTLLAIWFESISTVQSYEVHVPKLIEEPIITLRKLYPDPSQCYQMTWDAYRNKDSPKSCRGLSCLPHTTMDMKHQTQLPWIEPAPCSRVKAASRLSSTISMIRRDRNSFQEPATTFETGKRERNWTTDVYEFLTVGMI